MEIYQPDRKSTGRARERIAARQRKTPIQPMVTRAAPDAGTQMETRAPMQRSEVTLPHEPETGAARQRRDKIAGSGALVHLGRRIGNRLTLVWQDLLWLLRTDMRIGAGLVAAVIGVFLLFVIVNLTQGRVFPNVWALGVNLGGMNEEEARAALSQVWEGRLAIEMNDGDRMWTVKPSDLGMRLDTRQMVADARAVGLAGVPFGYGVMPVVSLDVLTAQTLMLNLTQETDILPFNAGYRWENDRLIGVPGSNGRFLDVAQTLVLLQESLTQVAELQTLDLVMTVASPEVLDPMPYMAQAQELAGQSFFIRGYDPFTNETSVWIPDRETFVSWLEAGEDSLSLRATPFAEYVDAQTNALMQENVQLYLEPMDAIEKARTAIEQGRSEVQLRIHRRNSIHRVEPGDSGYRIARRYGVSFYLLQQANPNRNWDINLSIDEEIVVPSPDLMLPLEPVAHKRIVVDIPTQSLWVFENGALIGNWLISTGMSDAPTSPGIYQVLSHAEVAEGSSVELCGTNGCGTWTMYWFMGIYEAVPGLVNGFHGAVLLPGGRFMGDNTVGRPWTYGCVMSQNDRAEQLYRWADQGTMVEIISEEFAPQSAEGRQALEWARSGQYPTGSGA
ncbi:MAG: L,D-transpeptidase family protein [Pleurocapsa minor GSE-CHR-MK-17-07R]|jgi:LysM repeat protein|nr:L,D-transpeptidase family protein [Pleurocapsa minor GSE-CHR-MK 17-07R]